jgi:glycosyltransferase involved in cell wall biosynthesis
MKILFFTETLFVGGKERRILELIQFLKNHTDYELELVITEPLIQYDYVYELGIPLKIIERRFIKYDPFLFIKFYKYCCQSNPDIIHTWGRMTTFYSIPVKLIRRVPIISSMIADAPWNFSLFSINNLFLRIGMYFSDAILSNSDAGLTAYRIKSPKSKVIRNGVNLKRFQQEFDVKKIRDELGITTELMVIMVASFSKYKDYDLFLDIAKGANKIRSDIKFVGVGDGPEWDRIQQRIIDEHINNVVLTGKKNNVEPIIAASDIGILCTFSEGISNSIIEYMALGKPVISTDITGGSYELIEDGISGYCTERSVDKVVSLIILLLNDPEFRTSMGTIGRDRISSFFSIIRMGEDFIKLYKEVLIRKSK